MPPPIHFHVSTGDDAPIYRQVVRQVVQGVAAGELVGGERLPSLRELAKALVVAPLTVKKAYDVLEAEGVIETRRGRGTFVSADAAQSTQRAAERLRPLVKRLAAEADVAGLSADEVQTLVAEELHALAAERERNLQHKEPRP